jgi:molybdate transport system substrate-binding protein
MHPRHFRGHGGGFRAMRPCVALVALLALFGRVARAADSVSIAAAANLVYALDALNAEFTQADPAVKVMTASGASGNLVTQIKNGAPYDVFLSADLDFPRALVAAGQAEEKSLRTFAVGRLVLWTTRPDLELPAVVEAVRNPAVKKLAIANRDTAPYGKAAQQTLEKLGAWTDAQPKLVVGENITQTAQFVETGNADAGFVALSLVLAPNLKNKGHWIEVPEALHAPLAQGAVLTTRGAANPAARRYLAFLSSDAAKAVLRRFGYGTPAVGTEGAAAR